MAACGWAFPVRRKKMGIKEKKRRLLNKRIQTARVRKPARWEVEPTKKCKEQGAKSNA
jgi:hypothetical protein